MPTDATEERSGGHWRASDGLTAGTRRRRLDAGGVGGRGEPSSKGAWLGGLPSPRFCPLRHLNGPRTARGSARNDRYSPRFSMLLCRAPLPPECLRKLQNRCTPYAL